MMAGGFERRVQKVEGLSGVVPSDAPVAPGLRVEFFEEGPGGSEDLVPLEALNEAWRARDPVFPGGIDPRRPFRVVFVGPEADEAEQTPGADSSDVG